MSPLPSHEEIRTAARILNLLNAVDSDRPAVENPIRYIAEKLAEARLRGRRDIDPDG